MRCASAPRESAAHPTPALPFRSRTHVMWSASIARGLRMRKRMLVVLCGALAWSVAGGADPLDLRDARPRQVRVAFEVSPTERPDAQNVVYSEPVTAWLEPGAAAGQVRVRVPGRAMERLLAKYDPVPG